MEKFTISRDDSVYEAFPDLVRTPSGVLVCAYRESNAHYLQCGDSFSGFARIIVRRSLDGGINWGPKQLICATEDLWQGKGYNCCRLVACKDGSVILIVDCLPELAKDLYSYNVMDILGRGEVSNIMYRSCDDGCTWSGPEDTSIKGIVPSIKELNNGDLIAGVTHYNDGNEQQGVYLSSDKGKTWRFSGTIEKEDWQVFSEGDFVQLDDGTIVLYLREDGEGFTGWRSYSRDGGTSWSKPVRSRMLACRGRPTAGLLSTGEVLVTYRMAMPKSSVPRCLAMFVESQEWALHGDDLAEGYTSPDHQRFQIVDLDRSIVGDSGYSGWAELDNGDVIIANYINDDAPRAFIRGYVLSRRDWVLCPSAGHVPWAPKGNYDMDTIKINICADLYRKNKRKS